jgi:hypothetical protein
MRYFQHSTTPRFSAHRLPGSLIALAGLMSVLLPYLSADFPASEKSIWTGITGLFAGLSIASLHSGTLIDLDTKKWKSYTAFWGYRFGTWKKLPQVTAISVISDSYHQSNINNGISPTLSGKVTDYEVVFWTEETVFLSFSYRVEKKAMAAQKTLSQKLCPG